MPMRPGVQSADVFGALFATYAAGLVGAARAAKVASSFLAGRVTSIAAAAWEAAEYLETGRCRSRSAQAPPERAYQLFETRDSRCLAIGTPNDQLFGKLMVLGRQLIGDPRCLRREPQAQRGCFAPLVEPAVRGT